MPIGNQPGWFCFGNGDETFMVQSQEPGLKQLWDITLVRRNLSGQTDELDLENLPYTSTPVDLKDIKFAFTRLSSGAIPRLNQALFAGGVDALLSIRSQETPKYPLYPFSRFY